MNSTLANRSSPRIRAAISTVALSCALVAGEAAAQSCASPGVWAPSPDHVTYDGTTCGQGSIGPGICEDLYDNPGPDYTVRVYVGPTTTKITLSGAAGFAPVMYMSDSVDGCADGHCVSMGDTFSPIDMTFYPPGYHFITVTAAPSDSPGDCGFFSLSMDGDLSGGGNDDQIFANGFDA